MTHDVEKPEWIERRYYPDGNLQEEIHYRGSSPHGAWRQWHPNGQLAGEWWLDKGVYVNGTNRTWHPDGSLASEVAYRNERIVSERHYSTSGKLLPSRAEYQLKLLSKWASKAKRAKPTRSARVDPASAAESDKFCMDRLAGQTADAREWLLTSSDLAMRNLGEMDTETSIALVTHLHDLGAPAVLAVEIETMLGSDQQTSNQLIVRLPSDPQLRAQLFTFGGQQAREQGFDAEKDSGQQYLYLLLC